MAKSRDPQRYDEEYQALQETLEDYLREQVSLLSDGAAPAAAPPESWWRRHRPDVYFVVTLALIGALWWRTFPPPAPAAGPEPVEQETSPPRPPSPPAAASTPPPPVRLDPPPGFDDPDAWWQGYVAQHAAVVADWLVAVSEARGLAAEQVSPLQKKNFAGYSATVRQASALEPGLLASVRTGLFEYVYGRWSREAQGDTGAWGRVDLVVGAGEYSAAGLNALAAELGREHWFEAFEAADKQLQTALIVAWIEGHEP